MPSLNTNLTYVLVTVFNSSNIFMFLYSYINEDYTKTSTCRATLGCYIFNKFLIISIVKYTIVS